MTADTAREPARPGLPRRLVVWMHAERYPAWTIPEALVARLRAAAGAGWEVEAVRVSARATGDGPAAAPPEVLAAVADAEVYFGFGITPEVFRAAGRLRWVHSGAAGVRGSLFPELRASDVAFTNSAGIHAEPLAEWAIGAMLHFARGFDLAVHGVRDGGWPYDEFAARPEALGELTGSTAVVVGYGGIGRAVGMRARALGMRVVAVRRHPGASPLPEADRVVGPDGLAGALREAAYVVLALPETDETQGLIGAAEIAALPPRAVLLNLSRGGIVDETALAAALARGALRGAALDVFREEPLPAGSPLRALRNVLITPHAGSVTPRFWERQAGLMLRNLEAWKAGRPLENRVDKERGY
ncbi:MAG: D-2-hydroxyacid dehydrogenase [Gemmatimonadota bacterium]|nr:D-2-hydroxyacid dehydrogenase [Gemmatimonadota bacterium]